MARFTFFIGKGGVGKTTVSAAYALYRTTKSPRKQVLLLSSDPAHSLGDVLQTKLGDTPKRATAAGRMWIQQINAQKQIDSFLKAEREEVLGLLGKGSLFTRDELEPLLDTSMPGMAEVAALLVIHKLLDSRYDEIVVDTAPMGHAIRLFHMPAHFAQFLKVLEIAASRDEVLARHFGGSVRREPAIDRWTRMVQRVEQALSVEGSKLVLVTTPEPFSLKEAARSAQAFETPGAGNHIAEIVLNRVVEVAASCPRCRRRAKQAASARKYLEMNFAGAKIFRGEDPGCPILGIEALQSFGAHVFAGKRLPANVRSEPPRSPQVKFEKSEWPLLSTPLTLTLGKGGVGKTTLSAALAYHHRKAAKVPVIICSIDPAPSLDDVFSAEVGDELRPVLRDSKFLAAEFDAMAEFREWAAELRSRLNRAMTGEERGIHVDVSLDRRFLLALLDITPPGVDEVFAVFRIMDLLKGKQSVMIDMAPTGHALEVLRTPARLLAWARVLLKTLAAHRTLPIARDIAVEVATVSQRVRELASILRDGKRCRIVAATLPEPLPDYETRRLLQSLRQLEAPLASVFINRVLIGEIGNCARCKRTEKWQAMSLARLCRQLTGVEVYVAREFGSAIAGEKGLQQFTRELWRPA